ncbi:MAG: SPFH domain-containing protein, partial [Verrucomicrobiota bacterium]
MNPTFLPKLIGVAVIIFVLVVITSTSTYVVEPGTRGIKITLGKAEDRFLAPGFGFKTPFITSIAPINIRQRTQNLRADCFSSDLQQVTTDLRVLYRVPEESVV